MADAKRDENHVPTLIAVSNADEVTPVVLWADPTTHRLLVSNSGGAGDVVGPASATNNAFVRFDGTTGKLIQNSIVLGSDTGAISGAITLALDGSSSGTTTIIPTAVAGTTTLTLPAATDTLVGKATTDTLTNKTIDADGTGNVITNIGSSEIKSEIITGLSEVTAVTGDFVMISDTGSSGDLKKADVATFLDGAGDVTGPGSSTDNAVARFDSTTGKLLQDSVLIVADTTGVISGTEGVTFNGTTSGTTAFVAAAEAGTTTVTLPAADDTLMGKATTDTMTNKTFDANGTGNSISNIDVADLANGTDGELITWSSSAAPATVAVGTAGQVLTSGGVGVAPTFQAAAGGASPIRMIVSTAFETVGRFANVSTPGSFSNEGVSWTTGFSSGTTQGNWLKTRGVANRISLFDSDPDFAWVGLFADLTSGDGTATVLCGSNGFGGTPTTHTNHGFGWKAVKVSGTTTFSVTNANGTTETATVITGPEVTNTEYTFAARKDGTTDIKYYLDKTLKATHTTNLPSGNDIGLMYFAAVNSSDDTFDIKASVAMTSYDASS